MVKEDLTPKQKQFCEEYIIDLNATQAAIRAGYSEKTARSIGNRLLTNVDIQNYIRELQQKRSERLQYTQDDLLRDLIEVKNRCMQAEPVMIFDYEEKCMVQAEEDGKGVWKFDSRGANQALDMLAKHNGFYEKDNKQKRELPVININGVKI